MTDQSLLEALHDGNATGKSDAADPLKLKQMI